MNKKFSKPFIMALAALPMATITMTNAEAAPRCKNYSKIISKNGHSQAASARVCRNARDEWTFKKLSGPHNARAKLAEHIYDDLWSKGYGILVDYIAPYDERDYRRHYHPYQNAYYKPSYNAHPRHKTMHTKHVKHAKNKAHKHGRKCDD